MPGRYLFSGQRSTMPQVWGCRDTQYICEMKWWDSKIALHGKHAPTLWLWSGALVGCIGQVLWSGALVRCIGDREPQNAGSAPSSLATPGDCGRRRSFTSLGSELVGRGLFRGEKLKRSFRDALAWVLIHVGLARAEFGLRSKRVPDVPGHRLLV